MPSHIEKNKKNAFFFVEVNSFFVTFAFEFGKVKLLAMLIRDLI